MFQFEQVKYWFTHWKELSTYLLRIQDTDGENYYFQIPDDIMAKLLKDMENVIRDKSKLVNESLHHRGHYIGFLPMTKTYVIAQFCEDDNHYVASKLTYDELELLYKNLKVLAR